MLQPQIQDMPVFRSTLDNVDDITTAVSIMTDSEAQQTFSYIKPTRKPSRRPSSNASPRSSYPNPYFPTRQPYSRSNTNSSTSTSDTSPALLPGADKLNFGLLNDLGNASNPAFARRNSSLNSLINTTNPFSAYYAQPRTKHSQQQAKVGRSVPESISEDECVDGSEEAASVNDMVQRDSVRTDSISSIYEEEEEFDDEYNKHVSEKNEMSIMADKQRPVLGMIQIPSDLEALPQFQQQQPRQVVGSRRNHRHSSHTSPLSRAPRIQSFYAASRPVSHISTAPSAPLASNPTAAATFATPPVPAIQPYVYPYPNPYPTIISSATAQASTSKKRPEAFTTASSSSSSSSPQRLSLQLRITDSATSPTNVEKQPQIQPYHQNQYHFCTEKVPVWQQEELDRKRGIWGRVRRMLSRLSPGQRVALGIVLVATIISVAVVLGVVLPRGKVEGWSG